MIKKSNIPELTDGRPIALTERGQRNTRRLIHTGEWQYTGELKEML